jgi:hypothetical protein
MLSILHLQIPGVEMSREFLLGLLTSFAAFLIIFIILLFLYVPKCSVKTGIEVAKDEGCKKFVSESCNVLPSSIKTNYTPAENLEALAETYYGCGNTDCIKRLCACPGY